MILDHNKSRVFSMESGIIKQKTLKVKIKKNFLTRGNYSLHAFINKPQTEQVDVAEDVCPFEIIDNGSIYNIHGSYDYGRVFPNVEWINEES